MDSNSPRTTPTRRPHRRDGSFVKPLAQPSDAVENSPQKPTMMPVRARAAPAAQKDGQGGQESAFHIHRPAVAASCQTAPRPTIPAGQGSNGSEAPQDKGVVTSQRHDTRQIAGRAAPRGTASSTFMVRPHWATYRESKFLVKNLPAEWYTREVHLAMQSLGNITFIDIPEGFRRDRVAYVTFTPPPRAQDVPRYGLEARSTLTGRNHRLTVEFVPFRKNLEDDIVVSAARLDFGVMRSMDAMLGLHSVHATPSEGIQLSIGSNKRIDIKITIPSSMMARNRKMPKLPEQMRYRFQINFPQITSVVQARDADNGEVSIFLSLDAPPLVYRKEDNLLVTHEDESTRWAEWKTWYRQTEVEQDLEVAKSAVKRLQRDSPVIDLGRWLTYRLTFDARASGARSLRELLDALEAHSIPLAQDRIIKTQFAATKAMGMWSWLDSPTVALEMVNDLSSLSDLQQMVHPTIQLPFAVRYQLEACISHGCLHECNIDQGFLKKLSAMATADEHGRVRTVKLLEKVVDEGRRFYDPMEIFRQIVPNMRSAFKQRQQAAHFVKVLTATVTPTTIYFNAPSLEPSNRVIRHYRQHEDRFLRVRFTDEKYKGKIFGGEDKQDIEVFTRVKRTMSNGIKIGDRVYEFLAYGNSQFRDHGAYFFAATGDLNAQKIRDWMGDFSHIKIVAKYCSRLGQALSTTRSTQFKSFRKTRIPDIERNGFCFTDGVGKISPILATLISSEVGMLTHGAAIGKSKHCPSAFQFRMGGCKGILVVDPNITSEFSVAIRPSQEKFAVMKHTGLEICRISQFTNASLNVQIILVLSALGVGDAVFVQMMSNMLSDIEVAMTNEDKAIGLLQKNIDLNQITVQVAQMILDGFMARQDPFMISCLRLWRSWSLKYLKEKQRIFVEDGAFVLGCIDETGTLEGHYDDSPDALPQIFLQIPDLGHADQYRVVEGICMLARNPCLHPGDVRIVRAVRCDGLAHICDCVVLPQKGDRDIANMCSGGDLDGDDYLVIWDEKLLPKEWNHPPMDYQASPPVLANGRITVDDMTSFFVTHMKYENVGRIAVAHKCWADREEDGVKSGKCLELAALHSKAVDYAKTGVPAEMPKRLLMGRKPHWKEGAKSTYHSKRVIGKLYDMVKRVDFVPGWELPFDARILEAYQLDNGTLDKARDVKEQYDEAVRRVMAKYDIASEFEVWSTFVLRHADDYNDYKFAEKLGEEVCTLKERFRKLCLEQISADEQGQGEWSRKAPFVAAMYIVTALELDTALAKCEKMKIVGGIEVPVMEKSLATMPFISFPWLFPTELGWIANMRSGYASTSLPLRSGSGLPPVRQAEQEKIKQEILADVPQVPPLPEIVLPEVFYREKCVVDLQAAEPSFFEPFLVAAESRKAGDGIVEHDGIAQAVGGGFEALSGDSGSRGELELEVPQRLSPVAKKESSHKPENGIPAAIGRSTSSATTALEVENGQDTDEEDEAEEVVLSRPAKKSAFDELEALLAS